jgi:hypothetical protein
MFSPIKRNLPHELARIGEVRPMPKRRRVLSILPSVPPTGTYSIYLDGAHMGVGNWATIERTREYFNADLDPEPFGAAHDRVARAEIQKLRPAPHAPQPPEEKVIASYKDAKAAGCDNREKQDIYVQNIYGPLPGKFREKARRLADVAGKPGPKPKR